MRLHLDALGGSAEHFHRAQIEAREAGRLEERRRRGGQSPPEETLDDLGPATRDARSARKWRRHFCLGHPVRACRASLRLVAPTILGALLAQPAWADPRDEARRHFSTGLELVRQGAYEEGVEQFMKAYAIMPHPSVLYNVARAYADAAIYGSAIEYFERYLASDPADRLEVESIMAALQMRIEAQREEALAAEAPSEPPQGLASATSQEIEDLRRHAQELALLAEKLQARGAATQEPAAGAQPVTGEASEPTEAQPAEQASTAPLDLGQEGLFEDLYDRVVVTAARYGQNPLDAPSAITVITAEDIRMSSAASVADLLRSVPGMDVMQLASSHSEIGIRGFNRRLSNKVLVLIDGRSVYLDFLGSTLWGTLPVTLEEIERIEIIRGTGSAIYGANAFSGVVNIITYAPGGPGARNQIALSAGSPGYGRGTMVLTGRKGDMAYRASMGANRHGRWAQQLDPELRADFSSPVEDQSAALDTQTLNAQLDWRLPKGSFASISGGYNQGLTEFYAIGTLRDFYADQANTYLRGDVGSGPFHLRTFWNRFRTDTGHWYFPTGGSDLAAEVLSDVFDVDLGGDWKLGQHEQHRLSAALGYRHKAISWDYLDMPRQEHHFGAYLQDESRFGPLGLTGSLRIDVHPLVGVQPSPRLAVVTHVSDGRALRLGGGTAFRAPTFMESYLAMDQYLDTDGLAVTSVGDMELEPENILSIEVGYLDHQSDWWRGEATVWYSRVNNLIDLGPIYADERSGLFDDELAAYHVGSTSFLNEDTVYRAYGGELAWEWFGIDGLDLSLNYALTFVQALEEEDLVQQLSTPVHKINAGVIYRSPWRVDAAMHATWIDKQVWPIRAFDDQGQVVVTDTPLDGWVLLSNKLVLHVMKEQRLDLAVDAWNWLALLPAVGPHREHPLGQPVDARVFGSLTTRF